MYDLNLEQVVRKAVNRIDPTMAEFSPFMAEAVGKWMHQLSGTRHPVDYFLHPLAFPAFLLPWWIGKVIKPEPDLVFQIDLAYSTANGYYYIRMIDNLMDGDAQAQVSLLPSLNFFHTEFQRIYQLYFQPDHMFWDFYRKIWFRSGEAAMEDAQQSEIDLLRFRHITAQKVCACKIPVAAVCYLYDQANMIEAWSNLIDLLCCWHQMTNDLFDWNKDLNHQTTTYFLSEAQRRKSIHESIASWVIREGFDWGSELLQAWLDELKDQAKTLYSPDLLNYLQQREDMFRRKCEDVTSGFEQMSKLLKVMQPKL